MLALHAAADGFDVYAVTDASGGTSRGAVTAWEFRLLNIPVANETTGA